MKTEDACGSGVVPVDILVAPEHVERADEICGGMVVEAAGTEAAPPVAAGG